MEKKKRNDKNDRTEIINFKVTPYEKSLIEKAAEKEGIAVAQFIRGELFMSMVMSGNVEMLKLVSSLVADEMRHKVKSMMEHFKG